MPTITKTVPNAEPAERATAALQIVLPVGWASWPLPGLERRSLRRGRFPGRCDVRRCQLHEPPGPLVGPAPRIDIARAHRDTMGISTITTGMGLALGQLGGAEASEALMAGVFEPTTVPGILSLGWWAAVVFTGWRLRRVFGRQKIEVEQAQPTTQAAPPTPVLRARCPWPTR
ncbi:hypothetical protein NKH18_00415 [Streptomyces sp. M10(2022)]